MLLRGRWLIGLIGLALVCLTTGQEAKAAEESLAEGEEANVTTTTKVPLTGNPQIDYKYDPNLPHELKGYDLSDYPFYSRLPEDLFEPTFNFSCDDRHDGFYASVPHKCQVYHNCLFGQRYDFLCANYTVFDQKNFICHYVSEVDCENSAKHYDRNDNLYETTTTTTTTVAPQIIFIERPRPLRGPSRIRPQGRPQVRPFSVKRGKRPGNRRTTTTPAPVYYDDYYYDEYYDQFYDDYYNDYANEKTTTTTTTTTPRPRRPNRPLRKRPGGEQRNQQRSGPGDRFGGVFNVRDRKRPRINPPVPQDDILAVDQPRASRLQEARPSNDQTLVESNADRKTPQDRVQERPRIRRPGPKRPGSGPSKKPRTTTTTTTTTTEAVPDYYYDDYYDYVDEPITTTTTTTTAAPVRRRPSPPRRVGAVRRPNRPEPTTPAPTTTTTEAPVTEKSRFRGNRPGLVSIRRSPLIGRPSSREPQPNIQESEPIVEPVQEQNNQPQENRPQRRRPQFPRLRPQSGNARFRDEVIVEEEPPLAPGLELAPDGTLVETAANEATATPPENFVRSQPRRPGQNRPSRPSRPAFGRPGRRTGRPQAPPPDYYDY